MFYVIVDLLLGVVLCGAFVFQFKLLVALVPLRKMRFGSFPSLRLLTFPLSPTFPVLPAEFHGGQYLVSTPLQLHKYFLIKPRSELWLLFCAVLECILQSFLTLGTWKVI